MQENIDNIPKPSENVEIKPVGVTKYLMSKVLELDPDRTIINEEITNAALRGMGNCIIPISKFNVKTNIEGALLILEKEIRSAGYEYERCVGKPDAIFISWDGSHVKKAESKE